LLFTFFCYADDDEDMLQKRLKQANLVGPAGYISMEDGYAAEIVQQAIVRDQDACSFLELGGTAADDAEDLVNETAIRGFWGYYRRIMGL
jgi:anthranilate 1,2-dioxygenase large subunit